MTRQKKGKTGSILRDAGGTRASLSSSHHLLVGFINSLTSRSIAGSLLSSDGCQLFFSGGMLADFSSKYYKHPSTVAKAPSSLISNLLRLTTPSCKGEQIPTRSNAIYIQMHHFEFVTTESGERTQVDYELESRREVRETENISSLRGRWYDQYKSLHGHCQ